MSAQRLLEAGGILGPLDKGGSQNLHDVRLHPAREAQEGVDRKYRTLEEFASMGGGPTATHASTAAKPSEGRRVNTTSGSGET